jgi:tRNA(Ile)-lysidine synthase
VNASPVPAITAAVSTWLVGHLAPADPIVVACSGGADSLALAAAVQQAVADRGGDRRVVGATVDHGLQAGSARQAATVVEQLSRIGYRELEVLTVQVSGPGGPEASARRARYEALRQLADDVGGAGGPTAVLLAHTADDQAETVLLGLARGSGPRSIAGMRPWRPPWGRPLLGVTRQDTEAACRAAGLIPWRDPHNRDPAFTRVRLRLEVLPLLEEVLGGGVRAALGRTAQLLAQDLDALDSIAGAAARQARNADGSLDIAAIADQPAALRTRVLRDWATAGGAGPLTFDHLSRMDTQLTARGPSQVRVPGGLDVLRVGPVLRLVPSVAELDDPREVGPLPGSSPGVGVGEAGWQARDERADGTSEPPRGEP